jgi:hypothetical protein
VRAFGLFAAGVLCTLGALAALVAWAMWNDSRDQYVDQPPAWE